METDKDLFTSRVFGIALQWTTFVFFVAMMAFSIAIFSMPFILGPEFIQYYAKAVEYLPKSDPFTLMAKASFAMSGALLIVIMLRYTAGPIEFNVAGVNFKGASGPVILWVLAFLAICLGINVIS